MIKNRPKHDLLALVSMGLFVVGTGLGALLLFRTVAQPLFGPPDARISGAQALAFVVAMILILAGGGVVGGLFWVLFAARFLPRQTVMKWLFYGPQLPPLTRLSVRILDAFSKERAGSGPAA